MVDIDNLRATTLDRIIERLEELPYDESFIKDVLGSADEADSSETRAVVVNLIGETIDSVQ